MDADAMATRMSVLTRALPSRILLVDDDELELELMADRLRGAGFEVARAANGQEALALLEKQWYPLVITDWQMPVMDGIAFTRALRERRAADVYIIMLTMREASSDYERGYVSGVDDYLSKKVPDAELFARIHAAFNTLALRRSLRATQDELEQAVGIDAQSGAFGSGELARKLYGELRRAQRYQRQLAVVTIGVQALDSAITRAPRELDQELLRGIVQTLSGTIRSGIDWVGRLDAATGAAFAVVLPEAGVTEAPIVKDRLLVALRRHALTLQSVELELSYGVAALERDGGQGSQVEPAELLEVAEHCRACPGCTGAEQLAAVQRSVAGHIAIACRHGYAVDGECSLKNTSAAAEAEGTQSRAG